MRSIPESPGLSLKWRTRAGPLCTAGDFEIVFKRERDKKEEE
jgi:hypothetical protein